MRRVLAVVLGILASSRVTAFAEEPYKPPDFLSVSPALPAAQDAQNVWRLDLADALRIAVKQNLDVVLERKSVEVASLGVDVADGAYEPTVTAGYRHDDLRRPAETTQQGTDTVIDIGDDWSLGIGKRFSTGTRFDINFHNGRSETNEINAPEQRYHRSTLSASITQPLFRGFSIDRAIPNIDVLRARIASDKERQQLAIAMTNVVERAEGAYWGVLQALYRNDLAVRTHKAAEDQLALTQRQIDAGTLPPSDLISAESTLAQRRLELVEAEQAVHQAWDQLRGQLNLPRDQWSRPILPTDVPKFHAGSVSAEDALAIAIKNRPELAQADLDLAVVALAVRKADNDRLPQIDLGLTGAAVGQDSKYSGALSELGGADVRGWSVFMNLTWTPLNRAAGAAAEIVRVQRDQTTIRREQLVQSVWFEVREAVRNQVSAERQVSAAAKFRELAEKSLDIEQRKFLNGTSQNLFVAQRQDALASARLAEINALLSHNRAAATLYRATGRLLAERHIELVAK